MILGEQQISNAFPYKSFIPPYISGLQISNNETSPNTILNISAGGTVDSTNTFQIGIASTKTINTEVIGFGGLDTGTLDNNVMYALYLVADMVGSNPSGCIFSKSLTIPLVPYGYNAYKLIGYFAVDSSSHIIPAYWTGGISGYRTCMYADTDQTQVLVDGSTENITTFMDVPLTNYVPAQPQNLVWIFTDFIGSAAQDIYSIRPYGSSARGIVDAITQVSNIGMDNLFLINSNLTEFGAPAIEFATLSDTNNLNIWVNGYNFIL